MLYETFNSIKGSFGVDYFTSRVSDEIIQNLSSGSTKKSRSDGLIFILMVVKNGSFRRNCFFIWRLEAEKRL